MLFWYNIYVELLVLQEYNLQTSHKISVAEEVRMQYNKCEDNDFYNVIKEGLTMLYDYLKETYGENEPIFVADIKYGDTPMNSIRQQIKKLTDEGYLMNCTPFVRQYGILNCPRIGRHE